MLTISLGIWMELPGVNYSDLTNGKRRYWSEDSKEKTWLEPVLSLLMFSITLPGM